MIFAFFEPKIGYISPKLEKYTIKTGKNQSKIQKKCNSLINATAPFEIGHYFSNRFFNANKQMFLSSDF